MAQLHVELGGEDRSAEGRHGAADEGARGRSRQRPFHHRQHQFPRPARGGVDSDLRRISEARDGSDPRGTHSARGRGAGEANLRYQPQSRGVSESRLERRLVGHRAHLLSRWTRQDARHSLGARPGRGQPKRTGAALGCVPDVLRSRRFRHARRRRSARARAAGLGELAGRSLDRDVARHGARRRSAQQRRAPSPNLLAALESTDGVGVMAAAVTRADVEDLLYREAALLDEWRLEEWLGLLTDDATYYVPPNDHPEGDPKTTLFILADDIVRIRERVKRLMSPECHAEYPHSRTRRLISNVRIVSSDGDLVTVAANFVCYRYRRYERIREYVGAYRYVLQQSAAGLRIKERRVLIDAHELGSLGSVSFIL